MKRREAWLHGVALVLCSAVLCACVPAGAMADEGRSAGTAITVWQAPQPAQAAAVLPRTGDGMPIAPIAALGVCAAACAAGVGALRPAAKGGNHDVGGN
mgnify:CR=1 FL=1